MDSIRSLFYFVAVLSILVLVHEWGHFFVAKWFKMRVDDFSLFFGPRLLRLGVKNGTEYNIRSIPLGGFVKIAGMEPEDLAAPINLPPSRDSLDQRKREIALHGLTDEAFQNITLDRVSERVRNVAADAIGEDSRLTESGKADIHVLLNGQTINEDEQRFLEAVLHTASFRPDPNGYNQKPLYQRALTIFAGPFVSLAFGYLLFCVMGFTVGLPDRVESLPVIDTPSKGKPAAMAGLKSGDRILSVNAVPVGNDFEKLRGLIQDSGGKPVTLLVERKKAQQTYTITPYGEDGENDKGQKEKRWRLGFVPAGKIHFARLSPLASIKKGSDLIKAQVLGTMHIFQHPSEAKENVGGIITIGRIIDQNSREGIAHVLLTAGMLSISLGIMNLLPIPVLDGGHLLLLAVEGIRRRKLTSREVYAAQLVGASIIALLFVFVMYNDISRWLFPPKP